MAPFNSLPRFPLESHNSEHHSGARGRCTRPRFTFKAIKVVKIEKQLNLCLFCVRTEGFKTLIPSLKIVIGVPNLISNVLDDMSSRKVTHWMTKGGRFLFVFILKDWFGLVTRGPHQDQLVLFWTSRFTGFVLNQLVHWFCAELSGLEPELAGSVA